MVDVNTTLLSWLMLLPICVIWQMLLPHGRCYCHKDGGLGDVIANVADVMATGSLYLFQFKFCDVVQNLIPHMWQMVFANVFVEGWTIDPYVYSLFNQPHEVVILSPHYTEVINSGIMTCDGTMVID